MKSQNRYAPNPNFGGRKEFEGFICSSVTRKGIIRTNCVAVKMQGKIIQIRDTKDANDTTLTFNKEEWSAFIQGVKKGEFDNL